VVWHKAWLVLKGYAQHQGIDYDEVFASVAHMEIVQPVLAVAAQKGWKVHHMDVKTIFLNGDLQGVYVEQPPGFIQLNQEHKVLKLSKALYGLHQAPRAWNKKFHAKLHVLGYVRSESDHAIYYRGSHTERLVVGVYVDDLVITGSSFSGIKKFKLQMVEMFKMSDLGLLTYYLGIEVKQSDQGILCQGNYAKRILEKGGLADCNPCALPMESKLKLKKESTLWLMQLNIEFWWAA
jgi:hypothetical protein